MLVPLAVSMCRNFETAEDADEESSGGSSGTAGNITGGSGEGGDGNAAGASGTATGGSGRGGGDAGGSGGDSAGSAGDGGAGDGGGGSGGASDWTPINLSNLVLWLEPTSVQTDETGVVAWHDRSPYAHSAVQELERKRPTFSPTALQGLPGVTFDGIDDVLAVADHAALRFGTNDLLVIEVVFLHTTIASASQDRGCLLLGKTNPGYPYAGPALVANCLVEGSTTPRLCAQLDALNVAPSPTGGYDDGRPRFAGIYRWPSGEVDLRINGVVVRRVAPSSEIDVTAEGFPLLIGGDLNDGTQALNGVISEVVAAIATQSDDVRALETYLLRKYSQALLGTLEGNGGE